MVTFMDGQNILNRKTFTQKMFLKMVKPGGQNHAVSLPNVFPLSFLIHVHSPSVSTPFAELKSKRPSGAF